MGAIEHTRKVLRDILAPELRAVAGRLDALEKSFEKLEKSINRRFGKVSKRFDEAKRRAERRHDKVTMMQHVMNVNAIQQRLARLESQQFTHQ